LEGSGLRSNQGAAQTSRSKEHFLVNMYADEKFIHKKVLWSLKNGDVMMEPHSSYSHIEAEAELKWVKVSSPKMIVYNS
jgi:hypothetical protein